MPNQAFGNSSHRHPAGAWTGESRLQSREDNPGDEAPFGANPSIRAEVQLLNPEVWLEKLGIGNRSQGLQPTGSGAAERPLPAHHRSLTGAVLSCHVRSDAKSVR